MRQVSDEIMAEKLWSVQYCFADIAKATGSKFWVFNTTVRCLNCEVHHTARIELDYAPPRRSQVIDVRWCYYCQTCDIGTMRKPTASYQL